MGEAVVGKDNGFFGLVKENQQSSLKVLFVDDVSRLV